jgi:hypothetical protein
MTIIVDHKFGKPNPHYRMQLAAYRNSTHVLSMDGTWRPTKSIPVAGYVVSTVYDEETESASTGVTEYNTSDQVYAEFLARKKILDLSLLPWRKQLEYAYVDENVRW